MRYETVNGGILGFTTLGQVIPVVLQSTITDIHLQRKPKVERKRGFV